MEYTKSCDKPVKWVYFLKPYRWEKEAIVKVKNNYAKKSGGGVS